MKYTEYLGLLKPELTDLVKVNDFNINAEIIDNKVNEQ